MERWREMRLVRGLERASGDGRMAAGDGESAVVRLERALMVAARLERA